MIYKNGKDLLPAELLQEIQQYIQGELIYIPKPETTRAGWGERNGARATLHRRNEEIWLRHRNGYTVAELTLEYHLSADSIKKILTRYQREWAG